MTYSWSGHGGLDYRCCSYGGSRLAFRGPGRSLDRAYCAVLGGTESFGKFVAQPYPDLLEQHSGLRVINLGCVNAGVDTFLRDEDVVGLARGAAVTIVQLTGAHALSNPHYTVHPRRNDRFLQANAPLRRLYPEVDFTEFTFARHLLAGLYRRGPKRFARLRDALATTWLDKVTSLIARIGTPVVGVWISRFPPPEFACPMAPGDPLLVTRAMVERLRPRLAGYVEVVSKVDDNGFNTEEMVFGPGERDAASHLPGPAAHHAAADGLAPLLRGLVGPDMGETMLMGQVPPGDNWPRNAERGPP